MPSAPPVTSFPARLALAAFTILIASVVAWTITGRRPAPPESPSRDASYRAAINAAARALETGDRAEARRLLAQGADAHDRDDDTNVDHDARRGYDRFWEWQYLDRRAHAALDRPAFEAELILTPHEGGVRDLAWSPNGHRLVAVDRNAVHVWSRADAVRLGTFQPAEAAEFHAVDWSTDGTTIATSSPDGLRRWDASTGALVHIWRDALGDDSDVDISAESFRVATVPARGDARVRHITHGGAITRFSRRGDVMPRGAFSPGGRFFAHTDDGGVIRVSDLNGEIRERVLRADGTELIAVAWDAEGQRIATGARDGIVRLFHPRRATILSQLGGRRGSVRAVDFSADGALVVAGTAHGSITIWDTASEETVLSLTGHTGPVTAVIFSRDGSHLGSASTDGTVRIWSAAAERDPARWSELRTRQDPPLDTLRAGATSWREVADRVQVDTSITADEREARLQRVFQRALSEHRDRLDPPASPR